MSDGYPNVNAGWRMERPDSGFAVPERANKTGPVWDEEVARWFRHLFALRWVGRLENVRYGASPFLLREAGVANLGGLYDFVLLDFMQPLAQIQRQAVKLAEFGTPSAAGLAALHVRVCSGEFYDADMHWLELHNPFTFQRETVELAGLQDLVVALGDDIEVAVEVFKERLAAADPHPTLAALKVQSVPPTEIMSAGLLLSELFSAKRIPFRTLACLRAALPDYAAAYRCVAELPAEGAGELDWRRLVTLYA